MATCMAADDIIAGRIFVHQREECPFDSGTLFVNGIVGRVCQPVDGLDNLGIVHPVGRLLIQIQQFRAVVGETLELNALLMAKKQHVDSLMDRIEVYFLPIVGEQETIVGGYLQMTQTSSCRLNAQLLKNGHSDGPQQQVVAACCL